jgi:toxin ParE1/3/4
LSGRKYRLTPLADTDIENILIYTNQNFGPLQLEAYSDLIHKAAQMVGESPMRHGSSAREELGSGVRSFYVALAAARKGASSHVLYYVPGELEDGTPGALILRVLHGRMEPRPFVAEGLDELE